VDATELYGNSRKNIANFINSDDPRTIVFVRNTEEELNLLAYSYGLNNLKEGGEIFIYLKIDNNKISDIKFTGKGCAISQASASILSEIVKGKDVDYARNLKDEDFLKELGIKLSPVRMKCALLSLWTLRDAISKLDH